MSLRPAVTCTLGPEATGVPDPFSQPEHCRLVVSVVVFPAHTCICDNGVVLLPAPEALQPAILKIKASVLPPPYAEGEVINGGAGDPDPVVPVT